MKPIVGAVTATPCERRPHSSATSGLRLHVLLGRDLVADLLQRATDQAGDVHLRDPDLLGDLGLRQAFEEAQVQDLPLTLVQHPESRREDGAVLGDVVLMLLRADRLERIELLAVLRPAAGRKRQRRVGAPGLERLEDLFLLGARRLGELGDRGRSSELHRQLLDEPGQLHVQLLQPARHAHRPALVTEVALDLADDVRRRVCRQLDAAIQVEAVDRLDQPDRADLDEIFELLAAVRVAPRQRAHERHVLLDQLLASLQVPVLVVAPQQNLVRLVHPPEPFVVFSRVVSSTHSPPSRSEISTLSQTALRIRDSVSWSVPPPCSSSARTAAKGPTVVCSESSSTRTRSVTPSDCARSSSASSASSRSSRFSNVRFIRTARPPSTRCATLLNASSAGSISSISSPLTTRPSDPTPSVQRRSSNPGCAGER